MVFYVISVYYKHGESTCESYPDEITLREGMLEHLQEIMEYKLSNLIKCGLGELDQDEFSQLNELKDNIENKKIPVKQVGMELINLSREVNGGMGGYHWEYIFEGNKII